MHEPTRIVLPSLTGDLARLWFHGNQLQQALLQPGETNTNSDPLLDPNLIAKVPQLVYDLALRLRHADPGETMASLRVIQRCLELGHPAGDLQKVLAVEIASTVGFFDLPGIFTSAIFDTSSYYISRCIEVGAKIGGPSEQEGDSLMAVANNPIIPFSVRLMAASRLFSSEGSHQQIVISRADTFNPLKGSSSRDEKSDAVIYWAAYEKLSSSSPTNVIRKLTERLAKERKIETDVGKACVSVLAQRALRGEEDAQVALMVVSPTVADLFVRAFMSYVVVRSRFEHIDDTHLLYKYLLQVKDVGVSSQCFAYAVSLIPHDPKGGAPKAADSSPAEPLMRRILEFHDFSSAAGRSSLHPNDRSYLRGLVDLHGFLTPEEIARCRRLGIRSGLRM